MPLLFLVLPLQLDRPFRLRNRLRRRALGRDRPLLVRQAAWPEDPFSCLLPCLCRGLVVIF
eukprot:8709856-Alexandrium_andersonii.AAC.1